MKSFEEIRKEWSVYIQTRKKIEIPNEEINNPCVLCGKETPYPIELDIILRHCYIEGMGQLCVDCCKKFNDKR